MSTKVPPRRIAAKAAEPATTTAVAATTSVADTAAATAAVAATAAKLKGVKSAKTTSTTVVETAVAETTVAETAVAETTGAETVVATVVAEAAEASGDEEGEKRAQLLKILEIVISPARCGAHLKKDLHDTKVEAAINAAQQLVASTTGTDENQAAQKQLAAAQSKRVRIGQTAPIAVAATWHVVLMDLFSAAIKASNAAGHKGVDVVDLHAATDAKYAGLYKSCPTWAGYGAAAAAAKDQAAEASKVLATDVIKALAHAIGKPMDAEGIKTLKAKAEAVKAALSASVSAHAETEPEAAAEAAAETAEAESAETEGAEKTEKGAKSATKTSFMTYVELAIKAVKAQFGTKLRVSHQTRVHLATLVAEGIKLHSDIAQTIVKGGKGGKGGARTFTSDHVKIVNSICLVGSEASGELSDFIDSKIAAFEAHRAAEASKKLETLTAEQKAERAAKEKEAAAKKVAADVLAADKALAAAKARVEAAAVKAQGVTA